jgi:hypothetical protein
MPFTLKRNPGRIETVKKVKKQLNTVAKTLAEAQKSCDVSQARASKNSHDYNEERDALARVAIDLDRARARVEELLTPPEPVGKSR